MEEIEEIKKLSPKERIEKLKELEEKRKKEIEEAEELIKKSVDEIQKEQEIIEQGEVSHADDGGVKKLTDEEYLESKVGKEELKFSKEEIEQHTQYSVGLSKEPVSELYDKVKDIYQTVKQTGQMTSEQQNAVNDFNYAVQYKSEDIHKGAYEIKSEAVSNIISASKQIINYMRQGR